MKLFIWYNVDPPSYSGDCLFILAPNLRAARKEAQRAINRSFGIDHNGDVGETLKIDVSSRKPDQVITKPRAAYYMFGD